MEVACKRTRFGETGTAPPAVEIPTVQAACAASLWRKWKNNRCFFPVVRTGRNPVLFVCRSCGKKKEKKTACQRRHRISSRNVHKFNESSRTRENNILKVESLLSQAAESSLLSTFSAKDGKYSLSRGLSGDLARNVFEEVNAKCAGRNGGKKRLQSCRKAKSNK